MSRYQPLPSSTSPTSTRPPSLAQSRGPSLSSFRPSLALYRRATGQGHVSGTSGVGSEAERREEMERAFEGGSEDEEDEGRNRKRGKRDNGRVNVEAAEQFTLGESDSESEDENAPLSRRQHRRDDSGGGDRYDDPLRRDGGDAEGEEVRGIMLGSGNGVEGRNERGERMPGSYDFDRDYFLPPPPPPPSSPPPFFPYSSHNPAPGNTQGQTPSSPPAYPRGHPQHTSTRLELLGSILPSFNFWPTKQGSGHASGRGAVAVGGGGGVGGGVGGVFANLAARPEGRNTTTTNSTNPSSNNTAEGPEWVPEVEGKDAPPDYNTALRDAVPPYWETTVVLPSHTSPFGSLTTSMEGEEVLIDGMGVGNFFAFAWNMLVSTSFQFIGFLLTYVLHTTHAARHGSRAGLGITLIQYGLYLRNRAEEMIKSGHYPYDPSDPLVKPDQDPYEDVDVLKPYWTPNPPHLSSNGIEIPSFETIEEAKEWESTHNVTMVEILGLPSAAEVGEANEWLSFMLMAVGWLLLLTSIGSYWRVKRFEAGLRAARNTDEDPVAEIGNPLDPDANNPRRLAYYSHRARQATSAVSSVTHNVRSALASRLPPLPFPLRRGGPGDENASRRQESAAAGAAGQSEGEAFLLFQRPDMGRDADIDMDDGVDIPGMAARQGLSTEDWSRRNLYHG